METLPDINYEYDYIRIVYEYIVTRLRANKKLIEKELTLVVNKLSQIKKKIATEKKIGPEIEKILDVMLRKLGDLESKYEEIQKEEDSLYNCFEERLNTIKIIDLKPYETKTVSSSEIYNALKTFIARKFNNLVLDFFLKEKYLNTAHSFINEENIKVTINLINIIRRQLSSQSIWIIKRFASQ